MIPFRNTRLYGMLKCGASDLKEMYNWAKDKPVIHTIIGTASDVSNVARGTANLGIKAYKKLNETFNDPVADAGTRLGATLGDLIGKINTSSHKYDDEDIIKLINDQEEIAVMNRETERLKRLARIEYRKRQKLENLTSKAIRSPFI